MDCVPPNLLPQSDEGKFLHIPHRDRWDYLKPIIIQLYTGRYGTSGRSTTIDQVANFMRTHYSFHAAPTEYPPRFRAWNVTKRVIKDVKDDVTTALGRRKRAGTSTSLVTIERGGLIEPVDTKKLRRHLKDRTRHRQVESIMPGLLSSWNLPYAAFVNSLVKNPDEPSPFGDLSATPEYLKIQSPKALTPGREFAGPSPNMQLVYEKVRNDRASLFLQGRLKELVIGMCQEDRKSLVDYFHDFYIHGFHMAKQWPLIPAEGTFYTPISPPPRWDMPSPSTPSYFLNMSPSSPKSTHGLNISQAPSQLCRWSLHVAPMMYSTHHIDISPAQLSMDADEPPQKSFAELLRQSIISDNFPSATADDLPFSKEVIVNSLESSHTALQLDAWRLAIMAGNHDLLESLFADNYEKFPEGIDTLHPFHLAATFLDGGHSCCMVIAKMSYWERTYAFYHNIDDLGHTILDALMVSILRSHTSITPDTVSWGFNSPSRFPGEEVDICGRWNPENPTLRELFKEGYARIPPKWKHPFCHTAVQAVCHSAICIFGSPASPKINALSGLFLRRCTNCGLELRLGPLHALVVTTFYLAQLGMPGETLFGAISLMVCLLALGADPALKVNISIEKILRTSEHETCHHTLLSALELMGFVPEDVVEKWSEDCKTGWICLLNILAKAQEDRSRGTNYDSDHSDHSDSDLSHQSEGELSDFPWSQSDKSSSSKRCMLEDKDAHGSWMKLPCNQSWLGLIWATIQAEFLTYRRVNESDCWISENFSMNALKAWLRGESTQFMTPLISNQMLEDFTPCGWFHTARDFACPTAQEVSVSHFMNMDIFERTSFLEPPLRVEIWADIPNDE